MKSKISILISTNRPYEYFSKRVIDSLFEQDMFNNEIIVCGPEDIKDPRIIFIKDELCVNGPQGYNQAAKKSTGDYLVVLTDDHYPPRNINDIPSLFNNNYFKDKKYKVATLGSDGRCYTGIGGLPRALMCRFPVMPRDTYNLLNEYLYHPNFNLKTPQFADHFLSIFLKINHCECVEFPLGMSSFQHERPEYNNTNFYEESLLILKKLVHNYNEGDDFVK